MDKQEFITKLMTMYPSQFSGSTCDDWVKEYELVLDAPFQISYDKLWDLIRTEYKYSTTPHTSWLKEQLSRCKDYGNPVTNRYVDIEITASELYGKGGDYIYNTTVTEKQLFELKAKGKKFKIVKEPYRIGG